MEKKKPFYGWVMVAACFVVMATGMGIIYNCNSLFIKPICDDLGYSRQSVNMMTSISSIGMMAASLFAGKIFNEKNVINVMKICSVVICAAFFSYSFCTSLPAFYIISAIVSVCEVLLTSMPTSFVINNWFYEQRGLAMGIASMGSGVGGMIFNSLTGVLLTTVGWRSAYQILAIITFVTVAPCVFFILKLYPSEKGLKPLGVKADSAPVELTGPTDAEVKKTPLFWSVVACAALIGMSMGIMFNSIAPHLAEIGYSTTFSANLLAISMGALAIGKLLLGKLFDKFGVPVTFTFSCATLALGTVGLYFGQFMPSLALVIVGVAFGCSFGAVCYPIALPIIFGSRAYRGIIGILSAALSLGSIFSPIVTGYIFDHYGSYNLAFIFCIIVMVIVTALQPLVFKKKGI